MSNKPKCKLIGGDGNIFSIMALASHSLKKNDMKNEAKEMREKVTKTNSYEEALNIISEYVEIV